jgi:predicted 3-demethylubiquinone-9 3-methyltransferase (glyoxalase superfamily)
MNKVTPFLWFDTQAEEAMNLYVSVFKNSKVLSVNRAGGRVVSVSFFVNCETQDEVDDYWEKLIAAGGEPSRCGWLKDKFGLSWQIIPSALMRLMSDPDPAKSQAVVQAMLKMDKIIIADLEKAHAT